jgi:hypothetical protein
LAIAELTGLPSQWTNAACDHHHGKGIPSVADELLNGHKQSKSNGSGSEEGESQIDPSQRKLLAFQTEGTAVGLSIVVWLTPFSHRQPSF